VGLVTLPQVGDTSHDAPIMPEQQANEKTKGQKRGARKLKTRHFYGGRRVHGGLKTTKNGISKVTGQRQ
jgi:hypothetical protein